MKIFKNFFCINIKLYLLSKNRDVISRRAKHYYYNNIDTIRKNMRDKYKNLLKEEKEKIKIY